MSSPSPRDRGTALPLVLVITVVLAALVIAIATYATTNLVYGKTTSDRADRLTAADAGMRYAIDQLKLRNAACVIDTVQTVLPGVSADFNGATASVSCARVSGSIDELQAWAAVMTGAGAGMTTTPLVSTQAGNSQAKVLGGPVYMGRVQPSNQSFDLGPPLEIENGPLFYYQGGSCANPVTKAQLPSQLRFTPDLVFGPICTLQPWTVLFKSPPIPTNLSALPIRNGTLPITDPSGQGSYTDYGSGGNLCRSFAPGIYIFPPAISGLNAYLQTGEYVFDFPDTDSKFEVRQGTVIGGTVDPSLPTSPEIPVPTQCQNARNADPAAAAPVTFGYGVTIYLAGRSHIDIQTQGSLEIHGRRQGQVFVSVQTLCNPDPAGDGSFCRPDGSGGFSPAKRSNLVAPAANSPGSTNPNVIFTVSGNNREIVTHGIIYAPLAQMEFGNVSNTANQKLLGGLVVSRAVLQAAASATNFEISVPFQEIITDIVLTSTATKNGQTSIQAVVEYRPNIQAIKDRLVVNSWRVCEQAGCPS